MGQVTIDINGRNYGIACDDGEESHIASLGEELASRVKQLSDAVGQVGDARLLVMAGLLLTDELIQTKAGAASATSPNATDGVRQIEDLAVRIESLAKQAEQVAERVDRT